HALHIAVVSGPAYVIHNFIVSAFPKGSSDAAGDIVESLIPTYLLPIAFAAFADAFQRMENTFGIVDLSESGRSLGAVAPATARMDGIALEFANLHRRFVDISKQSASGLAIEAYCGHEHVIALDAFGPFVGVQFSPIVPFIGRRIVHQL